MRARVPFKKFIFTVAFPHFWIRWMTLFSRLSYFFWILDFGFCGQYFQFVVPSTCFKVLIFITLHVKWSVHSFKMAGRVFIALRLFTVFLTLGWIIRHLTRVLESYLHLQTVGMVFFPVFFWNEDICGGRTRLLGRRPSPDSEWVTTIRNGSLTTT